MKKKLIYIIGAGRSGTTLLDIMLGNIDSAVSLGEINRFYKREGIPPKREAHSQTALFWKNIRESLKSHSKAKTEMTQLLHGNEYHSAFLKGVLNLSDSDYREDLVNIYSELNNRLTENILIESSKYPTRALNLSNSRIKENFDLYFIYLKKDPVRVVNSFQKKNLEQPSKSFLNANIYYLTVNLLCTFATLILSRRGFKTKTVVYQNLILNPEKELKKIDQKLEIDTTELRRLIHLKQPLKTGLLFDGNRIRLEEEIILNDQEKKLNKGLKYFFTRIFNYIIYR